MLPPAPATKPNPVKSTAPTRTPAPPTVSSAPTTTNSANPTTPADQTTPNIPIKSEATHLQHIKTIGPSGESLDEVQREVSRIEAAFENERSKRENDIELRRRMFPALAMPNDPNAAVSHFDCRFNT